ncbi:MAG: sigma 54-interacting transcriptional regulator [Candidatus Micrarchaeota archaeon]
MQGPQKSQPGSIKLVASSQGFREALERAKRVADRKIPVFICGETGVGKDAIARTIHDSSERRDGPFVVMPHLPTSITGSAFFGHRKGAFTGANRDQIGCINAANNGTIYFSEITSLPLGTQATVLNFLDDGQITRLGDTNPLEVDVRVISASNQPVSSLIVKGDFRRDLYYRIRGVEINIPPLRTRLDDIPPLIDFFLRQNGVGREVKVHSATLNAFSKHKWPGNVRELRYVVESALALVDGHDSRAINNQLRTEVENIQSAGQILQGPIGQRDMQFVVEVIEREGTIRGAARKLLLSETTIRGHLKIAGLKVEKNNSGGVRVVLIDP